jgi:cell wall assembly regulator SMI1
VQKFTRPITREIELGGERLALTFTQEGISVRPVGSRKPPREMSWAAFLSALASSPGEPPGPEQVSAAVAALKGGRAAPADNPPPAAPAPRAEAPPPPPTPPQPGAERTKPAEAATVDMPTLLGRLAHWLGQHRRRFLEGLAPGATSDHLTALQNALGVPLPDDLRELLAWHNGQDDETSGAFEGHWYLMNTHEIESAWRELTGDAGRGWRREWVPFLEDDRGNYVFLDTSHPGGSVRESSERNPEQPTVAPSLAAWLQDFVAAVERGEYEQDPERGVFVRRRGG